VFVRTEIRIIIFTLFAFQFMTATIGIWLVERTGPAIEMILAENDYSLVAAEDMVHQLASADPKTWSPDDLRAFRNALDRAQRNITEKDEYRVITVLRRATDRHFSEPGDVRESLETLKELVAINRNSMHLADVNAKQIAFAGGWTMVGFALMTLIFSLLMVRRSGFRLLAPIQRMVAVAQAYRSRDPYQRFEMKQIPYEFKVIGDTLNDLMDDAPHKTRIQISDSSVRDRRALVALMDTLDGPALLFDAEDKLVIYNRQGEDYAGDARHILESPDSQAALTDLDHGFRLLRPGHAA